MSNLRIRICFVCHGNICRSPTAEAVMAALVREQRLEHRFHIESAGTSNEHAGEDPDPRTVEAGVARGLSFSSVAKQFRVPDFERFDFVLAMDSRNEAYLKRIAPNPAAAAKVTRFLTHHPDAGLDVPSDVPDPYYGGPLGFERVIDLCDATCRALVAKYRDPGAT